jgi:hypothetical protein
MKTAASGYMPLSYIYATRNNGGKITVPMSGQALYTSFAFMSGVPAEGDSAGYSVNMLHILDLLMGQLERIKAEPHEAAGAHAGLSPARVQALIQQYGSEAHDLANAPASPYAGPAPSSFAEPGKLFSIAA